MIEKESILRLHKSNEYAVILLETCSRLYHESTDDYQEIMRLVEAGELVIEPADPEPEADA